MLLVGFNGFSTLEGCVPDTLALYENIWLCRNRLLTGILKLCKENVGRIPKIIGMDVVEMALWAQANAKSLPIGRPVSTDAIEAGGEEKDAKVTVERELVSKAEEDDMEALLGTYVLCTPSSCPIQQLSSN
jgi:hypothetical protein